jgi:hypothetical protein
MAPFAIRDPFELDTSTPSLVPPINPAAIHRSQRQQNDLFRFDTSSHQHRHHHQQHPQQYSLPINTLTPNSTSFNCHKLNLNSPSYAQFKIHHDRLPTTSSCSSSYNYVHYPPTTELALPTPVSTLSPHASSPLIPYHTIGTSARKNKVNMVR